MALHMLKLCVGAESIRDLEEWIEETRLLFRRLVGSPAVSARLRRSVAAAPGVVPPVVLLSRAALLLNRAA